MGGLPLVGVSRRVQVCTRVAFSSCHTRFMVVNIRLQRRRELSEDEVASDALNRRWVGYDPRVSERELWKHNRGRWSLSEQRLQDEQFASFSVDGLVVAVYRIDDFERVSDPRRGSKIALIGRPLPRDSRVRRALIGSPVPAAGRNPIQYLPDPSVEDADVLEHTRRAFLLTWNPSRAGWNDYDSVIQGAREGTPIEHDWSTGSRVGGISFGDQVFMLMQGAAGRGVVASGTALSEIYQDDHWDEEGGTANYVMVRWDVAVEPDRCLPTEALERRLPNQHWSPQSSGTELKPDVAPLLAELWSHHLAKPGRGGQGREVDVKRRRQVEDAAQHRLMETYRSQGWTVHDTRYGNPFDAVAEKDGIRLYLEAKGTQSSGESVIVTRGEVDFARANPGRCFMGIWSGIKFSSNGELDQDSGSFEIIKFEPKCDDLQPISYTWAHRSSR